MTSVGTSEPSRLRVFISYSRKDEDFAQELLAGLELVGFEPYLDKHDIAAGEDWDPSFELLTLRVGESAPPFAVRKHLARLDPKLGRRPSKRLPEPTTAACRLS
jgi:hypothetical protein